ncbi:multidrug transporter [Vulcanibacillus modesticaldus]|uniref:Multidrug transporter n=1 Tax=Vulcanibacillus modesticaldus TaxID=337097 RepID=A0A1D2YUN3_9BACI|nr:MFS transporter [Vulcanibacillus modesticaldus]OEF99397.1 multidrug transporter [Vulcanibacillus modesticaldus]
MQNFRINGWLKSFSQFNRNIRLFLLANVFFQIGIGIFMVLYNLYIRALGYPEQMNGNIISMTALAGAIILIPAGFFSDRVGRKKMMLIGAGLGVIILVIRAISESSDILLITAFLTGIFNAFVQVSLVPFLAENSNKEQRVVLFSFNSALMMVANMLGNIAGGLFTDIFQLLSFTEVTSFKMTLLIGVLFQTIALIPISHIEDKQQKVSKRISFKINFKKDKEQWRIIFQFTLATTLIGFGSGLVVPYLNLYFRDRFAASNSSIGFVVSLGQLATAVAMIIGPWMVKRWGEVRSVLILQLTSIPFLLLTGFTKYYLVATLGFLIRQALMNAGNPIIQSLMMDKIDDDKKGLANSLSAMVFSLGWAVMGPISTSIVAKGGSYWGYAIVFMITAILYTLSSVYFYLMFGRKKEDKPGLVVT